MARKVSFSALESRSARLRLKIRRRPYSGPSLARGISLMYRRNKTNGTWVLKASDGHGAYWTKGFALADDFEDADGKNVLTFYQAQDQAKKLARGEDGSADTAPITVDGALKAYRRDLDRAQRQSLQRRASARAPHQRAAVEAGGIAHGHRAEEMARRPARHDGAGHDQSALPLPVRRAGAGGAARRAHPEPATHGKSGLPVCRMRRRRATSIISDDKVREFVAAAYGLDHQVWAADRYAGDHWRASEPSRPAARRGSARPSGAAEADDAEVAPRAAAEIAARKRPSAIRCRSPRSWRPG